MPSGVELATAYVSLAVSTRGLAGDVRRELKVVDAEAAKAGKQAGSSMAAATAQAVQSEGGMLRRAFEKFASRPGRGGFFSGIRDGIREEFAAAEKALPESSGKAGKKAGEGFQGGFKGVIGKAGGLFAGVFAAGQVKDFLKEAIQGASDLNEAGSKINQIFGKQGAWAVNAFAKKGAKELGQTRMQVLDAAGTFGVFGKAAGLSGTKLAAFSTDFVGLSTDLASFHNADPAEVVEALGAALRGESEPMRRFGVLLDDASMRQEALRLGIVKNTKEALTPQQKVLAAQALIWKQTKDAQGDFIRTSDGAANKQRIITASFEDFKVKVGTAILPLWDTLLSKAAGFMDWISGPGPAQAMSKASEMFGPFISTVSGLWDTLKGPLSSALGSIKSAIEVVFGGLQSFWNVWGAGIVQFFTDSLGRVRDIFAGVFKVIQGIFDVFAGIFTGNWSRVWGGLTGVVSGAFSAIWATVRQSLATVSLALSIAWDGIKATASKGWGLITGAVSSAWGAVAGKISEVVENIKGILSRAWTSVSQGALNAWQGLVSMIQAVWNSILRVVAVPVNLVIDVIAGMVNAFNFVSDKVGGPHLDPPQHVTWGQPPGGMIDHFSGGGRVGGFSPSATADNIPAMLTADEEVIRQRSAQNMRRRFPGWLEYINRFGRPPGYASGGRVKVNRGWMDAHMYAAYQAAQKRLGYVLPIIQGGYHPGWGPSKGTHDGGGVADFGRGKGSWAAAVAALRASGIIAWFRNWRGNEHIHALDPALRALMAPGASRQVGQFLKGGNGLGGKDDGPSMGKIVDAAKSFVSEYVARIGASLSSIPSTAVGGLGRPMASKVDGLLRSKIDELYAAQSEVPAYGSGGRVRPIRPVLMDNGGRLDYGLNVIDVRTRRPEYAIPESKLGGGVDLGELARLVAVEFAGVAPALASGVRAGARDGIVAASREATIADRMRTGVR